ncbi:GTP cyclohydrolase II [Tabrizicola sp. M-4]
MTVLHRAMEREGYSGTRWDDALLPGPLERVARARADLRLGLPVVLSDAGQGWLVMAVEGLTEARFAAAQGFGAAVLILSAARLDALGWKESGKGAALPVAGLTLWQIRGYADPVAVAGIPDEPPERVDVAQSVVETAILLAKGAQLLPAVVAVRLADMSLARDGRVTMLTCAEVEAAAMRLSDHHTVSAASVPLAVSALGQVEVFRPDDGGAEHYAVRIGVPDPGAPVLVRLHSACFTGDVLGSVKCDCGPQLHAAMAAMAAEGSGVLLYLNQEGRGIGLANKMRAYALQGRGLDTVEANHQLGFADDERDFRVGAELLQRLGIWTVRLMTNNPAKMAMLRAQGITVVERVPLRVGARAENARYLAAKAAKSGHLLP